MKKTGKKYFRRLNVSLRVQHIIFVTCFVVLVMTGYMIKTPEQVVRVYGSAGEMVFFIRGILHRIAGTIFIITSLYLVYYTIFNPEGRRRLTPLIPKQSDVKDLVSKYIYHFGKKEKSHRHESSSFINRIKHAALIVGSLILIITGVILWTEYMWNKFLVDISTVLHSMQAVMACLVITLWYLYVVHLKPRKLPKKRSSFFMIHKVLIVPSLIFCAWLLQLTFNPQWVYVPDYFKFHPKAAETVTEITGKEDMIQKIEKHSDPIPRGHFHVTDEYIERLIHELDSNPPLCLKCHGTYPHRKDKKNSAILNLHHGFTACEICHVRKGPDDNNFSFAWADLKTGRLLDKAEGGYGKYSAILVPVKTVNARIIRLDEEVGAKFSAEYLQMKGTYTEDQLAEVKKVHEHNLSKEAVACHDCHNIKGYLDFESLGYSKSRSNRLSSPAIPNMLTKYDKFFIPQMFSPGKMRKKQQ